VTAKPGYVDAPTAFVSPAVFGKRRVGHDAPLAGALWQVPARRFDSAAGRGAMLAGSNRPALIIKPLGHKRVTAAERKRRRRNLLELDLMPLEIADF